eukprot:580353_1
MAKTNSEATIQTVGQARRDVEDKSNTMPIKVEIGGVEDKLRLVIKSEYRKGMKMRKIFSEITNHLDKKYVVKKFKKHEIDVIHSGFTGAVDNIIDIGNKSLTEYDVNEITSTKSSAAKHLSVTVLIISPEVCGLNMLLYRSY